LRIRLQNQLWLGAGLLIMLGVVLVGVFFPGSEEESGGSPPVAAAMVFPPLVPDAGTVPAEPPASPVDGGEIPVAGADPGAPATPSSPPASVGPSRRDAGKQDVVRKPKDPRSRRRNAGVPSDPTGAISRLEFGTLTIQSLPGTLVTLDGKPAGQTPMIGRKVLAGLHEVVLSNPTKHFTVRKQIVVRPDDSIELNEGCETGFLTVEAEAESEVFVDEIRALPTPWAEPLTVCAGPHTVRVVTDGKSIVRVVQVPVGRGVSETFVGR
jgi:hypothetical protein